MSKNKLKSHNQVEKEHVPAPVATQDGPSEFEKTLHFVREIVETFAIAFVLAFLFRTFEGELFSIPTGSMAPTLMGRHKDFNCPECGFQYEVSASEEFDAAKNAYKERTVFGGTCPICRYTAYIGADNPQGRDYPSFRGDNILVNKYTFNFRRPERWGVTVFRYPGDPQTSFIKRVVGLENETIAIHNGNIYVQKDGESEFQIARKPARQMLAMLQMVHDNDYLKTEHVAAGFPTRWHTDTRMTVLSRDRRGPGRDWFEDRDPVSRVFDIIHFEDVIEQTPGGWLTDDNISFQSTPTPDFTWLNYRHCIPTTEDWNRFKDGQFDPQTRTVPAQLVTDFTAYNTFLWRRTSAAELAVGGEKGNESQIFQRPVVRDGKRETEYACSPSPHDLGVNWVRDLALQCELTTQKPQGDVALELVGGGVAFNCIFNLEKGLATLSIPGAPEFKQVTAETPVKGTGSWRILFANIDDQLRLFVNSKEIEFPEHNGVYDLPTERGPTVRDLTPVAVGVRNAEVKVNHLTVWRDIYYIATETSSSSPDTREGIRIFNDEEGLRRAMSDPTQWHHLGKTHSVVRTLEQGQFFALGDNTAQSSDSRMWNANDPRITFFVPEKFLIGEALFVHWPHGNPLPGTKLNIVPNVKKMRFIH